MANNRFIKGKDGKFQGSLPSQPNFIPPLFELPPIPEEIIESTKSPELKAKYESKVEALADPERKAQYFQKENSVLSLFEAGKIVELNGRAYEIKTSDKPFSQANKGEPKTDVYILLEDRMSGETQEIKISYKSENYQFLENKMSGDRFNAIFNDNEKLMIRALLPLNERVNREFEIDEKDLLSEETRLTLGYRLDIMASDATGYMPITVSEETMAEILGGGRLEEEKRNGVIHGEVVENSGVANYILVGDQFSNASEALEKMIPIEEYVKDKKNRVIALAPKAVNCIPYRAKHFGGDKTTPWDGNRPLVMSIDWTRENGKLIGKPNTLSPLFSKWAHQAGFSLMDDVKAAVAEG